MRTFLPLSLLALGAVACAEPTAPDLEPDPRHAVAGVAQSASGSWTIEGTRTFAFNAERRTDGGVTGRWERVNQPIERREGGTVVCFVVQGNEVWVGTHTTHGPSAGTDGWFRAVDNGEGADAPPDGMSGHAVGGPVGSAASYCSQRPQAPSFRTVGAGQVQIRTNALPDLPGESTLLATIEWPFGPVERPGLPARAEIVAYYNGFYNPPPCTNVETRLADVYVDWDTPGFVHRYDALNDASFAGFVSCLTNGTDESLALGVEDVTGWGVWESWALDTGAPDLAGRTVDYIELEVDQLATSPSAGGVTLTPVMRWRFWGR